MVFAHAVNFIIHLGRRGKVPRTEKDSLTTAITTMTAITKDLEFSLKGTSSCGIEKYAVVSVNG
jgi:hypothetical protein